MKYGERLKLSRKHAGITQAELATRIGNGVTQAGISYLEKSEATGSEFTAQFAEACGVRPIWLASEIGPMIDEYRLASEIASKLDARELEAWYRAGRALAEPEQKIE